MSGPFARGKTRSAGSRSVTWEPAVRIARETPSTGFQCGGPKKSWIAGNGSRTVSRRFIDFRRIAILPPSFLRNRKEPDMPESVYKVIELVGSSPESWEKAVAAAVKLAAREAHDLRIAEVIQQDVHIGKDGSIESYRAKIRVSFKHEG